MNTALTAIGDENTVRSAFARKVLKGEINLPAVAIAVVANPTIGTSIAAAEEDDDTFGVDDASIAFVLAEDDDPATGVFDKMSRANAAV